MRQLRHLNLGWCIGLGDAELSHLAALSNLATLILSYTKVGTQIGKQACSARAAFTGCCHTRVLAWGYAATAARLVSPTESSC
jgi:hypothetical protein